MMTNISKLLKDHVSLSTRCIDRLYINGYISTLQTPGQVGHFLIYHLGNPIASPALLKPRHDDFVEAVHEYARVHDVPIVRFQRGQRKDDVARKHHARFEGEEGVVFIGIAQERSSSFKARKCPMSRGGVTFSWSRQSAYVNHFYFYVRDLHWGPGFLKIGSYLPYPVKLCLNGHEWAKQRLRDEGVEFESLDNGFLWCEDSELLQGACDALTHHDVQRFFDVWSRRLPWPMTMDERKAGYDHRLSIWQCEVSLTHVFDRPLHGRHFFEAVIRDNLDLGRPDRVKLLFPKKTNRRTPPPRFGYRTRVITQGVSPSLHVEHRKSHVKQYFKEDRALRTETTINEPGDFGCRKSIHELEHLRDMGDQVNRKLLEVQRVSENCILSEKSLENLHRPAVRDGKRASAIRFGDLRIHALLHALCLFFHLPDGFRNRDLRKMVVSLLGRSEQEYSSGSMTYDLRRLRLRGLIHRIDGSHRYTVTTQGVRVSYFYTKVYMKILRPGMSVIDDDNPQTQLQKAFDRLDDEISRLYKEARLQEAS